MIPPTHFAFPAAIGFVARHRAPEAAEALTPEARQRLAEAAHAARLARLEAAVRGKASTPVALPPDRLPPGRLLASEAALAEATDAVQQDLRTALQSGEIRATGFRADGAPVPLPPGYWRGPVRWCVAGGATIEADAFERAARGDLVPMEGGFVEPALARGEVARWCGALPPEPAAVYSPEALRAWYRLRVASWPTAAPPPTEREDAVAAAAMFGRAVPRDTLRAARRSLAPTSWRRPGPRRRS